jgi:hypothetical protein
MTCSRIRTELVQKQEVPLIVALFQSSTAGTIHCTDRAVVALFQCSTRLTFLGARVRGGGIKFACDKAGCTVVGLRRPCFPHVRKEMGLVVPPALSRVRNA